MRKERARENRRLQMFTAQGLTDDMATALPGLYPAWNGAGVSYAKDYIVQYDGGLYRCLEAHTSQDDWAPGTAPSLWVAISDPAEEWPEWRQPAGAHDAYAKGAKVSHNGKHWVSDVDGNTWEPGAYGWTQQDE